MTRKVIIDMTIYLGEREKGRPQVVYQNSLLLPQVVQGLLGKCFEIQRNGMSWEDGAGWAWSLVPSVRPR